jgi:hypothetical protein
VQRLALDFTAAGAMLKDLSRSQMQLSKHSSVDAVVRWARQRQLPGEGQSRRSSED